MKALHERTQNLQAESVAADLAARIAGIFGSGALHAYKGTRHRPAPGRIVPRRRLGEYLARFSGDAGVLRRDSVHAARADGRAARGDRSPTRLHVRTHISLNPRKEIAHEPSCDTSRRARR